MCARGGSVSERVCACTCARVHLCEIGIGGGQASACVQEVVVVLCE